MSGGPRAARATWSARSRGRRRLSAAVDGRAAGHKKPLRASKPCKPHGQWERRVSRGPRNFGSFACSASPFRSSNLEWLVCVCHACLDDATTLTPAQVVWAAPSSCQSLRRRCGGWYAQFCQSSSAGRGRPAYHVSGRELSMPAEAHGPNPALAHHLNLKSRGGCQLATGPDSAAEGSRERAETRNGATGKRHGSGAAAPSHLKRPQDSD